MAQPDKQDFFFDDDSTVVDTDDTETTSDDDKRTKRVLLSIVSVFCVVALVVAGIIVVKIINSPLKENKQTASLNDQRHTLPGESPAALWMNTAVTARDGVDGNSVSTVNSDSKIAYSSKCAVGVDDQFFMDGRRAGQGKNTRSVLIYAPGTATKAVHNMAEDFSSCANTKVTVNTTSSGNPFIKTPQGFVVAVGDAVVVDSYEKMDKNTAQTTVASVSPSLKESQCRATTVPLHDYTRNPLASTDYRGYVRDEKITSGVSASQALTPVYQKMESIEVKDMEKPEEPLGSNIPSEPDTEVKKPTVASAPPMPHDYSETISYQVVDADGPGSGWGWSQFIAPTEDAESLQAQEREMRNTAQTRVNEKTSDSTQAYIQWGVSTLKTQADVNTWNTYARETNEAHDKWSWLVKERAKVKDAWMKYVNDYNYWYNFETIQEQIEDRYNDAVDKCSQLKQDQKQWDKKYDKEETQGGGDTGIPERPKTCSTQPKKPSIIGEDRPKEPARPHIPEGVTIPHSWGQPDGSMPEKLPSPSASPQPSPSASKSGSVFDD